MLRSNDNNLTNKKTMDLIKIAEEAFATGKQHPNFKAGDTVTVAYRIVEGNKERVQNYRGVVIKISGHGEKRRFTVRKMSGTVGVERIFPIESPAIDSIEVNKIGKVRRAKLYYLRALTGKKARIKEKRANGESESKFYKKRMLHKRASFFVIARPVSGKLPLLRKSAQEASHDVACGTPDARFPRLLLLSGKAGDVLRPVYKADK